VLIVDDDRELAAMLAERLSQEGWLVEAAQTGSEGSLALSRCLPDAVLLDVMLPDATGWDLCRRWRTQHPALGLLMLTARADPMERVLGLGIGADDYLSKPCELRELVARLRALLRRQAAGRDDVALLRYGSLSIDLLKRGSTSAVTWRTSREPWSSAWVRGASPDTDRASGLAVIAMQLPALRARGVQSHRQRTPTWPRPGPRAAVRRWPHHVRGPGD
jgi:CheY-like chemotaxis protein